VKQHQTHLTLLLIPQKLSTTINSTHTFNPDSIASIFEADEDKRKLPIVTNLSPDLP
jgi:hypothetical protein